MKETMMAKHSSITNSHLMGGIIYQIKFSNCQERNITIKLQKKDKIAMKNIVMLLKEEKLNLKLGRKHYKKLGDSNFNKNKMNLIMNQLNQVILWRKLIKMLE